MLVPDPITTSPITAAVGAMNASAAMVGVMPSNEKIGPNPPRGRSGMRHFPRPDAFVQAKHQSDVLHSGLRTRPLAEIVEPRDQHGLAGISR